METKYGLFQLVKTIKPGEGDFLFKTQHMLCVHDNDFHGQCVKHYFYVPRGYIQWFKREYLPSLYCEPGQRNIIEGRYPEYWIEHIEEEED